MLESIGQAREHRTGLLERDGGMVNEDDVSIAQRQDDKGSVDADQPTPDMLFRLHYVRLTRMATLILGDIEVAEEVVQDAFANLVERWPSVSPDHAVGYLYRSVTNGSRSILRRLRTRGRMPFDRQQAAPGADAHVIASARDEKIRQAVLSLPRRQREVVALRFYADRSVAETAEILRISSGAVAVASHHALKALRLNREELS